MANITLTVQDLTRSGSGLTPSYTAMNSTDVYFADNNGRVLLHCKNTNASPGTLTVETPNTVDGLAITDYTATIPATTGDKMIGMWPPDIYNQSTNQLKITASLATGMSIAAIRT